MPANYQSNCGDCHPADPLRVLRGSEWLRGVGVPTAQLGRDGDWYVDTATGLAYQRTAGVWAFAFDMRGAPGNAAQRFEHAQITPATVWTVNHNLGFYPDIETFTIGRVETHAEVIHLSVNTAQVINNQPETGFAIAH